jgi:hypothetical protein
MLIEDIEYVGCRRPDLTEVRDVMVDYGILRHMLLHWRVAFPGLSRRSMRRNAGP